VLRDAPATVRDVSASLRREATPTYLDSVLVASRIHELKRESSSKSCHRRSAAAALPVSTCSIASASVRTTAVCVRTAGAELAGSESAPEGSDQSDANVGGMVLLLSRFAAGSIYRPFAAEKVS
jgi:hypothetical protein